jgi:hypothetical protein
MADRAHGRRITEMLEYDGGRQVTVYVPPDPPDVVVYGAVFCASPGGGYTPPRVMPNRFPRTYLSPARRSRFSWRTPSGGHARWALPGRSSGCASAPDRTVARFGGRSSRSWWHGHSRNDGRPKGRVR